MQVSQGSAVLPGRCRECTLASTSPKSPSMQTRFLLLRQCGDAHRLENPLTSLGISAKLSLAFLNTGNIR